MQKQTAKTPTVAIARVLKGLGLIQGQDFRIKAKYKGTGASRQRIGTHVAVLSKDADQVIADNADHIEEAVQLDGGWEFRVHVSIHYTAGGRMWTWVANYGSRIRDNAPVATADKNSPVLDTTSRKTAHELAETKKVLPGYTGKLGEPRPAFGSNMAEETAHPYNGKPQEKYGTLIWACETVGEVWFYQNTQDSPRYTLRYHEGHSMLRGWYLTGLGISSGGFWVGYMFSTAAEEAEDAILAHEHLAGAVEATARDWPEGTRVQGFDAGGVLSEGSVNGLDVGVVSIPDHEDYGRTYVGVTWVARAGSAGAGLRSRPFTDELVRL